MNVAKKIIRRINALAKISEEPGKLTRKFASPAMQRANEFVAGWMREAGMVPRVDAVGNLIGRYEGSRPNAKSLLLGSHLDTVCDAGRFDGPLGVLLAIAVVEYFQARQIRLPFALEVIGFADEEGVRYQTTYLGSKAVAGCFDSRDLKRRDADGILMADAIRNFTGHKPHIRSAALKPEKVLGYLEAHIEQGPVLEEQGMALGVVTAIAGQTRSAIRFLGKAGHAGTTPMALRQDALCAASEFVLALEKLARSTPGLVATVGLLSIASGASNVIPGQVNLSVDLRHASDKVRQARQKAVELLAATIATRRKIKCTAEIVHEAAAVDCAQTFSALLEQSIRSVQPKTIRLPSGAGHDAAVMAEITPTAMLFIRCRGGVSHHPDESVTVADVQAAYQVMAHFVTHFTVKP